MVGRMEVGRMEDEESRTAGLVQAGEFVFIAG